MQSNRLRRIIIALVIVAALGMPGCSRQVESRPSILLFVIDTLRADAVSAYGAVAGTTPAIDALAADGILYEQAYANAAWTVPSHASLFSGLFVNQHGADWKRPVLSDSVVTLAERLNQLGYETVGLSENPWVSGTANLHQGFERFASARSRALDLEAELTEWLSARDSARPFFLFVNVIDPHWPYEVEEHNAFLPAGVRDAEARNLTQWPPDYICAPEPHVRASAIQQGLYHGEVAKADTKLASIRARLHAMGLGDDLRTIVTSDHGEHFGEKSLAGHQFSVYEPLLRIPLVVHGGTGVIGTRVTSTVQLVDIVPSVLAWLGVEAPAELPGHALPTTSVATTPAPVRAQFAEPFVPSTEEDPPAAVLARQQTRALRTQCGPRDRVWGDIATLIRDRVKLVHFERFPDELYDLHVDPHETSDLAGRFPELTAALGRDLASQLDAASRPEWSENEKEELSRMLDQRAQQARAESPSPES